MRTYKYIISLFIFALSVTSHAQTIRHLGTENGLSNGYVSAIAQDGQGFMWIATDYGLNMFDGSRFFTFNQLNSELDCNLITSLLFTPADSVLWVGTDDGLYTMDYHTKHLEKVSSLRQTIISDLCMAEDGGVWVVFLESDIVHIAPHSHKTEAYSGANVKDFGYSFRTLLDVGDGIVYVGYAGDGFARLDTRKKQVKNYGLQMGTTQAQSWTNVYSIFKDSRGQIWLGTNNGLVRFSMQDESFHIYQHQQDNSHSLNSNHIYDIDEINGSLWICSDVGGINIVPMTDFVTLRNDSPIDFRDFSEYYTEGSLSSRNIRKIFVDSFQNIWIGNWSFGLDFIGHTHDAFQKVKCAEGIYKPVWAVASDGRGGAWIGSENQFAHSQDGIVTETIDITPLITRTYAHVQKIFSDHDRGLFLGLFDDGLLYYSLQSKSISRIQLNADYLDINAIYPDTDGSYLIGTEAGLYRITSTSLNHYTNTPFHHYIAEPILISCPDVSSTPSVFGIVRDKAGSLWCGTYGNGILVLDKDYKCLKRLLKDERQLCTVSHLMMDSKGRIWASTRRGLVVIEDTSNPDAYRVLDGRQGLGEVDLRTVIEDASGDIWAASNSMIAKWNAKTERFENFDFHQGIPMGNFGDGCSARLDDGTLIFGSLGGACYFSPLLFSSTVNSMGSIKPEISDIKSPQNRIVRQAQEPHQITVPYDIGSLKILFNVPDFSLAGTLDYSYKIDGMADEWTPVQDENSVTLHYLQPGKYVLSIRAKLKNEDWDNAETYMLHIEVRPPFWQTWWAYLIYILVLCAVGYLILRAYRRRINLETSLKIEKEQSENVRHLNEERLRFFTNVAHELRTPLTLILGPLEDMADDTSLQPSHHRHVESVLRSARQLGRLINQILEFRKTESQNRRLTVSRGSLSDLVTETTLPYKDTKALRDSNVEFVCDIEKGIDNILFDRDIVTITINNLLSNAFKYTPSGQVCFSLKSVEHTVVITVSDTGYGIAKEALPHIFDRYYQAHGKHQASGTGIGLALVASLIKIHQGTIDVTSEEGKGTTFIVTLPADEQYPDAIHKETDASPTAGAETQTDISGDRLMLIVEDNVEVRQYIADTFRQQGFSIIQATNGREGAEQAFINVPDIIISDVMMPQMNGFELLNMLKGDVRTSHIPIILLTAKDTVEDREEGYLSGADSYITKPFTAKLIRSRVENLLASRKVWADYILQFPHASWEQAATTPAAAEDVLPPRENQFVEKLNNLIMQNIDAADLDISFLTDNLGMSHSTCYRKIKGLTGLSPNEYVRRMRLSKAAEMLKSSELNISEISYACGFSSPSYFRTCFKEIYNMTPKEYATRN